MSVQAIAVENLSCWRGGHAVVSGVSFKVIAGSALILRGPNGSGKTTLLRTLAGFLPAASGAIEILYETARLTPLPGERHDEGQFARFGSGAGDDHPFHYVGHANGIKPRLSVFENVRFWQDYYGIANDIEAAEAALDAFGLLHLADYNAAHLSQGQARRLGLARLRTAPRPVWLLDEPSVSLDAASTALLEHAIASHLAAGGIAIVSTHLNLSVADASVLDLGAETLPQ